VSGSLLSSVELNAAEKRAADAILVAMAAVYELSQDGEPANFTNEVIPAIHTLQMFVLMHWAHRIHPSFWSDWFWESDTKVPPSGH
jgi:hypothetical protein